MKHTTLAIAAIAAFSTAITAQEMEEIKLEFPKPMFIGTPVPAKLPNLETPDPSKIVKTFMAPKGTVNLAKDKAVTSSDPAPIIGDLPLVTDGDADGSDGCFVELAPGPQWVQIETPQATAGKVFGEFVKLVRMTESLGKAGGVGQP